METVLSFDKVVAPGLPEEITFDLPRGTLAGLLTTGRESSELLVRLLLGFEKPARGSIAIFGQAPPAGRNPALHRRLAVLHSSGGLISNLKVWENLLLPAAYHTGPPSRAVEERALALLERLGYHGGLMAVPGHLSLFQRRLIGLARAMLMDPELIIYCGALTDLSDAEGRTMAAHIRSFHAERPERTTLFLSAESANLRSIPFDETIPLMETVGHG